MSDRVGYVVVEFNQASGQPEVMAYGLFESSTEAAEYAETERARARSIGRRESYEVGEVRLLDDAP